MPNCPITKRAYQAKQEHERTKLRIVTFRSYPDYNPITIEEKFIKQGSD